MAKSSVGPLDTVFSALADRTRRGIIAALTGGPRAVSALAQPFAMSLPGFMKHLRVLEDAGLLERTKEGRVVNCSLTPEPMKEASAWLARYQTFWEQRLDALDRYLDKESESWPQSQKNRRSRLSAASKHRPKNSGAPSRSRKR